MSFKNVQLAHAGLPANDTSKRETCTSTGYMMSQSEPLPPASSTEKYPKIFINTEQVGSVQYIHADSETLLKSVYMVLGCCAITLISMKMITFIHYTID
jgi:hypothetical protein